MDKMKGARADQGGNAKAQSVPTGTAQITDRKSQTRSSPCCPRPLGERSSQTSRMTSPAKSERLLTQQPYVDGTPAQLPGAKKTQSLSAVSNETRAVTRQKSKPSGSITELAKKTTVRQAEETRSSEKREKAEILSDNLRQLGLNSILLDVPRGNHCWEHVLRAEVPERFKHSEDIRNLLLTYLTTSRLVEPSLADLPVHNLLRELLNRDDLTSFNELAPVLALYLDKPVVIVNLEAPQQEATRDRRFYCVRPGESNLTITESIPAGLERAVKFGWIMSENHYLCLAEKEGKGSLSICAVCLEPLAYPRAVHATPCGHWFDKQCLIALIKNDCQSRSRQKYYKCPTCRSNIRYFRCEEGTPCNGNGNGVYLTKTEKDMHAKECDCFRNLLATIIQAFASAGVFAASWHTGISNHQVELAKILLNGIKANDDQRTIPCCIFANDIANLLWAVATLLDNGLLERSREFEEAVATVWPQVVTHRHHFDAQGIINLLWAVAKLVDNGLYSTLVFKEALAALRVFKEALAALLVQVITKKDHFNAHKDIANLLWAVAKLVDNGVKPTQELKETVAALLHNVSIQNHFNAQDIASLLWAVATLVGNGLEQTQALKETVAALLHKVSIQNHFNARDIASLLLAVAKLVDKGLEQTPELKETVTALLPHVIIRKANFKPQEIANLLWAVEKLVDKGLEQTQAYKEAVAALLPHIQEEEYFEPQSITRMLWAVAKLVDNGRLEQASALIEAVTALLFHVNIHRHHFIPQQIANLLWAVAKLLGSGLEQTQAHKEAVAAPLPHTRNDHHFKPQSINSLLWAVERLVDNGLGQTQELKDAVAALLSQVNTHKDHFAPLQIASLLWAIGVMGEFIEEPAVFVTELVKDQVLIKLINSSELDMRIALWGLLAVSARQSLCSLGASVVDPLEQPMRALFDELKKPMLYDQKNSNVMAMAASWLNLTCEATPSYDSTISHARSQLYSQLERSFPYEEIEQEVRINHLPPVDIMFPKHKLVIQVHGPQDYVGGDYKTRKGKTMLKVALYQNLGYRVIDVPVNKFGVPVSKSDKKKGYEEIICKLNYAFNGGTDFSSDQFLTLMGFI